MKSADEANERAEAALASCYNNALHRVVEIVKDVQDRDFNKLKAEWNDKQEKMAAAVNAVMALCET